MGLLRTGDVVAGKYCLLKPLGKGGEGSVWLAVHLRTEQLWAVKEIRREGNGREFYELNMLKKLSHPSLVRIFDVAEEGESLCLIMEYIRGRNLSALTRERGRMPPEQALELGCQLCRVLHYLHNRPSPVYHLDLKPSNLIMGKNGKIVLVDFGAAKKPLGRIQQEESRGTDGFAAPEQYDPEGKADARADVFGLGATLYFLVSGVRYSEALAKSRVPGCPESLENILKKCLRKNPEERFADIRQLERSLCRLRRKLAWKRKRIRFWYAALLAVAALGLAWREVPREFFRWAEENWNYEKLLAEAYCMETKESFSYYQKAVFLDPGRKDAYLQFVEVAEADAFFSREEEQALRILLHTIPVGQDRTNEEQLAEEAEEYGPFAVRLGMAYWYSFEGEEGRKLGTGWFRKALSRWEEEQEKKTGGNDERKNWAVQAEIFAHMGSYYESLGKEREEKSHVETYWADLKRLLEQGVMETENPLIELRFYQETVNQILFLSEELENAGISRLQRKKILQKIRENTEKRGKLPEEQGTKEELIQEILSCIQTAEEVLEHEKEQGADE